MNLPPPPPFQKTNQHIVPRFWQKEFAGQDGRIFARYRTSADPLQGAQKGRARQANVAELMTSDWTYTVFDRWWRPSDEVRSGSRVFTATVEIVGASSGQARRCLPAASSACGNGP